MYSEPTTDYCICSEWSALPTVPVYKKNRIASLLCIFETTIAGKFQLNQSYSSEGECEKLKPDNGWIDGGQATDNRPKH